MLFDYVDALPFPLKGAVMPATWSKAYLRERNCVMSRAPPLGTDGAFMHRGRLRVHDVMRIIAESVYVRVEAYLILLVAGGGVVFIHPSSFS